MPADKSKLYYLYLQAMADAVFNSNGDEKLAGLRCGAIRSAYENALAFFEKGLLTVSIPVCAMKGANRIKSTETI